MKDWFLVISEQKVLVVGTAIFILTFLGVIFIIGINNDDDLSSSVPSPSPVDYSFLLNQSGVKPEVAGVSKIEGPVYGPDKPHPSPLPSPSPSPSPTPPALPSESPSPSPSPAPSPTQNNANPQSPSPQPSPTPSPSPSPTPSPTINPTQTPNPSPS